MLVTLLITDNDTVNVSYKTDLPVGATAGNFTIMDINDLNDSERHLGLDFKQIPSSIEAFVAFVEANGYVLIRVDDNGKTVLANATNESSSSLLDELF